MPSGKVHDKVAVISIAPVFLAGYFLMGHDLLKDMVLTGCVLFSQLMFGPDLDARSTQYKRWGIFRWIWIPYRKIFRHRSRFSHGLLFGAVLRCIYLLCFIFLVIIGADFLIYKYFNINTSLRMINAFESTVFHFWNINFYIILIIAGFTVGAAIHTLTDKIVSFFNNLL